MKRIAMLLAVLCLLAPMTVRAEEKPERYVCGDYTYELLSDGTARIVDYALRDEFGIAERDQANTRVEVPAELDGHAVTEIGKYAFSGEMLLGESMVLVGLPEGLKRIEEEAFFDNSFFVWLRLPESVEWIGENAFLECHNCAVMPGSYAERYCRENGIPFIDSTEYGDMDTVHADWDGPYFYYALGDGPATVICYMDEYTGKAVVPDEMGGHPVGGIGQYAFWYGPGDSDNGLETVVLPDSLVSIDDYAFVARYGLKNITLPEGLERLGTDVFGRCALTSIRLPDSLTSVGDNPFEGCSLLEHIEVSPEHPCLEIIDGSLYSRQDHRLICWLPKEGESCAVVPDGTETIDSYAFTSGTEMERIVLPASVRTIGQDALYIYDDLELLVPGGSFAEHFCRENNLNYTVIDE